MAPGPFVCHAVFGHTQRFQLRSLLSRPHARIAIYQAATRCGYCWRVDLLVDLLSILLSTESASHPSERPKPVPSPAMTSISMLGPDDSYTGSVVLSGTLKSQSTAGRKISMKKLPPLVASRSLRSGPPSPTLPDTTKSAPVKTGKVGAAAGNSGKPGVFRPSATPGSKTDISAFAALHEDESIDDAPFPDDNRYSLLSPVHPLLLPPALVTVDEAATVFHSCCCVSDPTLPCCCLLHAVTSCVTLCFHPDDISQ
jgi:hypothetical protein